MNKRIKIAASAAFISPLLVVGAAHAREANTNVRTAQAETQTTIPDELPEQIKAELQKRLEERKNQFKLRLQAAELRRLQQRCKAAQGQTKKVGDKVKSNVNNRHKSYEALNTHLTTIIEKLEAKGADVTELKSQHTILNDKITAYKSDMDKYQQALDDLSAMDCAADPTAFKASLEDARKLREGLAKSVADIRTYVKDTLKPTLVEIRQSLAKETEGEG